MAVNGDLHEPSPKIPKLTEETSSSLTFLKVKKLSPNAILPSRASSLSAGFDLSSAAKVKVPGRGKALVPTDLSFAIPEDTYARIAPRLGLAWKHSIDVGAGVIDADYRGLVGVILFNHLDLEFEIKPGDHIAQLIIENIITPDVVELDDLDSTVHGVPKLTEDTSSSLTFLKVKKLSLNAILPSRASSLSAGYDLSSAAEVKVPARGKALVATDLSIAIPEDTYARIAPRSGLTWKHFIDVGAGVIDVDYRGPVGVILFNHSDLEFVIKPGDRIAQLIIQKIITPDVVEVDDLYSTVRGVPKLTEETSSSLNFFYVKKLSPNAILPSRASSLSAGYDLSSAVEVKVPGRGKAIVSIDLSIAIPEDTYARIAPRFGPTWEHSIDVGAGVIDADYRGLVDVILFNHSDLEFEIKPGDHIAQLIIQKIITLDFAEFDDLDSTVRGVGGFGSTGVSGRI